MRKQLTVKGRIFRSSLYLHFRHYRIGKRPVVAAEMVAAVEAGRACLR